MKITLIEANQDLGVHVDGANLGPSILTNYFKDKDINIYKVYKDDVLKEKEITNLKKNLVGVNSFSERLYQTCLMVKENNQFPLVIGGDHTVAMASSLASLKKEEKLGIIWIDAHGDYNTFETTKTGNLHGLPLAAVNGNCSLLTEYHDNNFFKHTNTVIVGGRDIDKWEMPNIIKDNVTVFTTEDINEKGIEYVMCKAFEIASKDTNGIHISYDLDVIDPKYAPGVSVPAKDGITPSQAYEITNFLVDNKELVKSLDLVEFNPTRDIDNKTKDIAINILETIINNF